MSNNDTFLPHLRDTKNVSQLLSGSLKNMWRVGSDHMIPMRGAGFQMIPICRAQLLGNSLGYYLVADRSILVSFEILRLRIGIM